MLRKFFIFCGVTLSILFLLLWISRNNNYYNLNLNENLDSSSEVLSEDTSSSGSGSGDNSTNTSDPTPTPTDTITDTSSSGSSSDDLLDTSNSGSSTDPTPTPTLTEDTTVTSTTSDDTTFTSTTDTDSGTGGSTTTEDKEEYDRLTYFDKDTADCIKDVLESHELDTFRFLQPTTSEEEERLRTVIKKAETCYDESEITSNTNEPPPLDEETKQCLISRLGEDVFNEINSGQREPTEEESRIGEECFDDSGMIYDTTSDQLDQKKRRCLSDSLGRERYVAIRDGDANPNLEERKKIDVCFGVISHPIKKKSPLQTPDSVNSCLKQELGEDRAAELTSGRSLASLQERERAASCFEQINQEHRRFLPPPPAQVPFLKQADKSLLDVDIVRTRKVDRQQQDSQASITITGSAPINSVVDIYVFSEPIVVTTRTDDNGEWVYEFSGDELEQGEHVAYATVRDREGESVRSAVYNFEVLASEEVPDRLLEEDEASSAPDRFLRIALIIVIIAAVLVAVFGVYITNKRMDKEFNKQKDKSNKQGDKNAQKLVPDGQGEGETTSGTVD